jgi:Na+/melibiose symporter-like transporter
MNKFIKISIVAIIIAATDTIGSLLGFWGVTDGNTERCIILTIETAVVLTLVYNSFKIRKWVLKNSNIKFHQQLAFLSLSSIIFCFFGDLVNFNLPKSYYNYGSYVKHDYLLSSVVFFGPGYALLITAIYWNAFKLKVPKKLIYLSLVIGLIIANLSFLFMKTGGTNYTLKFLVYCYSIIVTLTGVSGILFYLSYRKHEINKMVYLITLGCLLAPLADLIIGTFWIFGNEGQGFYPVARYANWFIYISSQALVILMPQVVVLSAQKVSQDN